MDSQSSVDAVEEFGEEVASSMMDEEEMMLDDAPPANTDNARDEDNADDVQSRIILHPINVRDPEFLEAPKVPMKLPDWLIVILRLFLVDVDAERVYMGCTNTHRLLHAHQDEIRQRNAPTEDDKRDAAITKMQHSLTVSEKMSDRLQEHPYDGDAQTRWFQERAKQGKLLMAYPELSERFAQRMRDSNYGDVSREEENANVRVVPPNMAHVQPMAHSAVHDELQAMNQPDHDLHGPANTHRPIRARPSVQEDNTTHQDVLLPPAPPTTTAAPVRTPLDKNDRLRKIRTTLTDPIKDDKKRRDRLRELAADRTIRSRDFYEAFETTVRYLAQQLSTKSTPDSHASRRLPAMTPHKNTHAASQEPTAPEHPADSDTASNASFVSLLSQESVRTAQSLPISSSSMPFRRPDGPARKSPASTKRSVSHAHGFEDPSTHGMTHNDALKQLHYIAFSLMERNRMVETSWNQESSDTDANSRLSPPQNAGPARSIPVRHDHNVHTRRVPPTVPPVRITPPVVQAIPPHPVARASNVPHAGAHNVPRDNQDDNSGTPHDAAQGASSVGGDSLADMVQSSQFSMFDAGTDFDSLDAEKLHRRDEDQSSTSPVSPPPSSQVFPDDYVYVRETQTSHGGHSPRESRETTKKRKRSHATPALEEVISDLSASEDELPQPKRVRRGV